MKADTDINKNFESLLSSLQNVQTEMNDAKAEVDEQIEDAIANANQALYDNIANIISYFKLQESFLLQTMYVFG